MELCPAACAPATGDRGRVAPVADGSSRGALIKIGTHRHVRESAKNSDEEEPRPRESWCSYPLDTTPSHSYSCVNQPAEGRSRSSALNVEIAP